MASTSPKLVLKVVDAMLTVVDVPSRVIVVLTASRVTSVDGPVIVASVEVPGTTIVVVIPS